MVTTNVVDTLTYNMQYLIIIVITKSLGSEYQYKFIGICSIDII